jgi:glycosyltransferase involved in cell wall biosynthesis
MPELLRVLTFNWHEAYLHLLSKTGHAFDVVQKRKAGLYGWIEAFRPVPENVRLVHLHAALERLRAGFYDRVIAHNFEDLLAVRDCGAPIVLVFHNKLTTEIALSRTPVDRKAYLQQAQRLMGPLPDLRLVFVSPAKQLDWGLEGRVILPGIDPGDYSGYLGDEPRVLRIGNGLKERDLMLGWSAQERILEGIPSTVVGLNPSLPESVLPASWDELRSLLVHHRVFLNTTLPPYEDGYNLAMLEAMATGMPVVSIANPSSPIEDGVNGFLSADEGVLRERILELLQDRERAIAIGRKARETVLEHFPIDCFLGAWREVLEEEPRRGRAAFSASAPLPARATAPRRRPRVLLSYTANPQTTGAYLERGLRSLCDVLTYGPTIDEEVLRKWDLEKIRGRLYGHDLPYCTADLGYIQEHLPGGWRPDLFLWVESGVSYPLHGVSSLPCTTACWLIDTHLHLERHLEVAKSFDFVFLAQKKYVPLFQEAGIRHVHWLPLACDPEIHRDFGLEPVYDVTFVGSVTAAHRRRNVLLQQLSRRFPLHLERCFLEEMALVFSRSRIVFNCSVRDDLNMRVFEALSSGSLLLTDQADGSGLEELFEDGRHLAIYRSPEELEERVAYYLGREEERARIGREGMQEVRARHTYAHRAAAILERVGLWESGSGSLDPARNGYRLGCGRHDDRIAQAIGEIYAREGRPEVAFEYFSQALSLNPENAHALKGMISTARSGADRAETIKSLEAYLALHPADLELTLSHAGLCLQAGLPDESRRSVERILLFDPSHEAARYMLDRLPCVPDTSGDRTPQQNPIGHAAFQIEGNRPPLKPLYSRSPRTSLKNPVEGNVGLNDLDPSSTGPWSRRNRDVADSTPCQCLELIRNHRRGIRSAACEVLRSGSGLGAAEYFTVPGQPGQVSMEEKAEDVYRRAEQLAQTGVLAEAEALYESLLAREAELDPELLASVWNDLAVLSVNRGDMEKAVDCLSRAIETFPYHRQAWDNSLELEELAGRRPRRMDLHEYLKGFYASDANAMSYISVHLRRFSEMLAVVGRGDKGLRLLELGANMYFSMLLRRFTEYNITHTDLWEGEREKTVIVRSPETGEHVALRLYNFDVEKDRFPFDDETFDLAIAAEIIEHLPNDPMFMMHELNRVLKTGGRLLVTTPNITSLRSFHAVLHSYPPYIYNKFSPRGGGRHCKEYAPREIALMFKRSGFAIDELKTLDVWIESDPATQYWDVYRQTYSLLKRLGASLTLRGEDIFALGHKVSAPKERYPVELYD